MANWVCCGRKIAVACVSVRVHVCCNVPGETEKKNCDESHSRKSGVWARIRSSFATCRLKKKHFRSLCLYCFPRDEGVCCVKLAQRVFFLWSMRTMPALSRSCMAPPFSWWWSPPSCFCANLWISLDTTFTCRSLWRSLFLMYHGALTMFLSASVV